MMASMVAIIASALYTGATWYITFVEHPAQLACRTEVALEQWAHSVSKAPRNAAVYRDCDSSRAEAPCSIDRGARSRGCTRPARTMGKTSRGPHRARSG